MVGDHRPYLDFDHGVRILAADPKADPGLAALTLRAEQARRPNRRHPRDFRHYDSHSISPFVDGLLPAAVAHDLSLASYETTPLYRRSGDNA